MAAPWTPFLPPDNKDKKKTTPKCNCYLLERLQNSLLTNIGSSCSIRYRQQGAESLLQAKRVSHSKKKRTTKRFSEESNALLRPTGCWFASHPIMSYWGLMTQEMVECLGTQHCVTK